MQTALATGPAPARIRWASRPEGEIKPGAVGPPAARGRATKTLSPLLVQIHGRFIAAQLEVDPLRAATRKVGLTPDKRAQRKVTH